MDGDDTGATGEGFPPRLMSAAKFTKKPSNSLTARGTLRKHHGSRRGGFMQQSALRSSRFNKTAAYNGIFCSQIPDQLNYEDILRQHFEQFGDICELKFFEQNNSVSVIYSTCKEAEEAITKAKNLDGFSLSIQPYQPSSKLAKTITKPIQGSRVVKSNRKSQEKTEICRKLKRRNLARGETPPSDTVSTAGNPFNQRSEERKPKNTPSSNLAYRTNKEKLDFLDKVDQLLRVDVVQESDVSKVKSIKGTCPDICPEKERYLRMERNLISVYEMDEQRIPRHDMMIKEYSRSSADRKEDLAHELRPSSVLQSTMEYMLKTVLRDIDYDRLADWYDFTWNRTRAIRKDISIQEANDEVAIGVVEQCARFHICCAHQLCEEEHRTFDPKINNENLEKTMKTLLDMYSDNSIKGNIMRNEAEFKAYHILLNINKSTDVLTELQTMSEEVRTSVDISRAISAFCSVHSHNYVRFFKVVQQCSYLQAALLHRYFTQVRMNAIVTMTKAYRAEKGLVQISTEEIINILHFNGMEELEHFATYNSIPIENGIVQLHRNSEFGNDDGPSMSLLKSQKIEYKMNGRSLADIISNGAITMSPQTNEPTFSFDEQDRYIGAYEHLLQSNYHQQQQQQAAEPVAPPPPPTSSSSSHDDVTSTQAAPSSREMAAMLEKRGISNDVVKVVAKNLINSAIDESLRDVCSQTLREACFHRTSILVADRVLEEEMTSQIRQIAMTTLQAVETHRRQEEERLKRDLELRMRRAAEERKMKEEQLKLEQLREETRKQKEVMMSISISNICDELESEVKKEMCRNVAHEIHRKETIAACCAQIRHEVLKETTDEETRKICHLSYKEIRNQKFAKLTTKLVKTRRRHVFERWRLQLHHLRNRRMMNQSFPGAPPLSSTIAHQVMRLSRCKSKSHYNDVTSRLTTSSTISLMKRQRIEVEKIRSLEVEKERMEDISLNERFDICDILKKNHPQCQDGSKLLWKLTIVVYSGNEELVEWIGRKFGIDENLTTCSREHSNISFVCNMINGDELTEHSLFATSAIIAISVGKRGGCYGDDGWSVREIMTNLQENVEEMPPVCMFTKSLPHQDECFINSADEDAIKCLIIEDDVIRNHIQIKRELDWLTSASSKSANVVLKGKPLRSYYEGILMENYFEPLRECCNTIDVYNLEPIPANEVIESFNYVILTSMEQLMAGGCCSQWPSHHLPSLVEYSLHGGKRWNDQRSLKQVKELSRKLLLPKIEEFNEKEASLDEFVESYCKPFADFDILFEPQLKQLLAEFNQSYYDDLDFHCELDSFSSFPWLTLVELLADSLIKGHLYDERDGGSLVYFPRPSGDEPLYLPPHMARHLDYVRGVAATTEATAVDEESAEIGGGHKMELDVWDVEHEDSLDDSSDKTMQAGTGPANERMMMSMTSHVVRSRREEKLNQTMNTSFELSDRIFQERQISNRFEKYLEKLLLDGGTF